MTEKELESFLADMRRGRLLESKWLDWKRQWWALETAAGKEEFRKDIVALANSASERGVVIIGYKDGSTYSAEPPIDEAQMQQILQAVSPAINIRLEVFQLKSEHSNYTSVLLIEPPFDRPYVERRGSMHYVWVRHGSSTGTASRYDLDSFYRQSAPEPSLSATWRVWEVGQLPSAREKGTEVAELPVVEPKVRIVELSNYFAQELQRYRRASQEAGYPSSEQLAQYEQEIAPFLASLTVRENIAYWYCQDQIEFLLEGTPFSVSFVNSGQRPATECRLQIDFPDWLLVLKKEPARPEQFVPSPFIAPRPAPKSERDQNGITRPFSSIGHAVFGGMPYAALDLASRIPSPPPTSGAWVDQDRSATFWADGVLHAHEIEVDTTVYAVALPTAPKSGELVELTAQVFCQEQSGWQTLTMPIRLVRAPD